jgi:hypothetical protein
VAGAWRELVDLGRDLGIGPAGPGAPAPTRREFATRAEAEGLTAAGAVAAAADAAVFGPADPDDAAAVRIWQLVAEARRSAKAALPLRRRLWVAVNPASLLAYRRALPGPRAATRAPAARAPRRGNGPRRRPGKAARA